MTKAMCVCVATLLCAAAGTAASDRAAHGGSVRAGVGATTVAARAASIFGTAWQGDNTPVANARLRLRNVISGRIEATTVADESGRFTFTGVEGGTYVVELVSETGKILTVGHVFAISAGETIATFVRLSTKVPWFTSFFSNAAAAVATTAAAQGVTALAPVAPAVTNSR